MGLDSYSRKKLDQVKNDFKEVDEIEKMNLDPDLKAELRKAKMNLQMEQSGLERKSDFDKMIDELNHNSTESMDSVSLFDRKLWSSNNNQSIQQEQEESVTNFGKRYSEEEIQQAKERIHDSFTKIHGLINALENSNSVEEERTTRHR